MVSSVANAYSYLIQHLSVGVQQLQGNRASVLGNTRGHSPDTGIGIGINVS